MAVIERILRKGTCYEVRRAGHSLRLYTDGVFHSQFNRRRILSGGVWDILSMPALFYPPGDVTSVLALGVGGGAVLRQLECLIEPELITGVELDPVHVQLMKKHFGIGGKRFRIVRGDAVKFVRQHSHKMFDMVIDDLFTGNQSEPQRAVDVDKQWFASLSKCVSSSGMLVINFESRDQLKETLSVLGKRNLQRYKNIFSLTVPGYENCVGVFLKQPASSVDLRGNIKWRLNSPGWTGERRLPAFRVSACR